MELSLMNKVRLKKNQALKDGDKETKQVYTNMLNALTNKAKDLLVDDLTPAQEIEVVTSMVKQIKDSIEQCPAERTDVMEKLKFEESILMIYMPKQMDSDEIKACINEVLVEMGIEVGNIKKSDKGRIMKVLMPRVKGRADGKFVGEILSSMMN